MCGSSAVVKNYLLDHHKGYRGIVVMQESREVVILEYFSIHNSGANTTLTLRDPI